jgi:FtsP/CotA-like multicopper oxidase with cupredoxin domain
MQSFVDILTADSDPLSARSTAVTTMFASAVGDPSNDGTYFLVSANLTGILTPGSTYRLRFVEADNQLFFNNGVDNVSLLAEGGQVPEPSSMILAGAGLVFVGWIRRRSL